MISALCVFVQTLSSSDETQRCGNTIRWGRVCLGIIINTSNHKLPSLHTQVSLINHTLRNESATFWASKEAVFLCHDLSHNKVLVSKYLLFQAFHMIPLAAFRLPSPPAPASQKALALQGLDPGLLDAETVDSAQTRSIDRLELSPKTRKRLTELGITELFAGEIFLHYSTRRLLNKLFDRTPVQSALIPFLLPPSPYQRALYVPYNPPRDVCVSAPTGSGKTLAYVIPILEVCYVPRTCNLCHTPCRACSYCQHAL